MNMKKRKTYLAPSVETVRVQIETSLLDVSPGGSSVTPTPTEPGKEGYDAWEAMAKKQYNAWETWEDENEDDKLNNVNFQ